MESAGRGYAMIQLLRQHLEDESHWARDADQGCAEDGGVGPPRRPPLRHDISERGR